MSHARRALLSSDDGQTVILFAFALVALMGIVGLVVDYGFLVTERRMLQNAADAGALAAAGTLPGDPSLAVNRAQQYVENNGVDLADPRYALTATTPYLSDPSEVEVVVSHDIELLFWRVLGLESKTVTARAVARGPAANYAIYVGPACGGDADGEGELEGNDMTIDGAVFAADLEVDGDSIDVNGAVEYLCDLDIDAGSRTFASGPTALAIAPPPPVAPTYADFTCTFTAAGNLLIDDSTPQYWSGNDPGSGWLKPGVYCAPNGEIEIHGPVVNGNVTFVSHDEIELHSDVDTFDLTAFQHDVLAYTDGVEDGDDEGEIEFAAKTGEWIGMLIAPNGEIELEGNDLLSTSTLLFAGEEVEVEGDRVELTAYGGAQSRVMLVE
jgi:Flp pilus assembly protein TadG